jgi:hypothetical protein
LLRPRRRPNISFMPDGQIVLVTTEPLEGGEPLRTIYYVAEEDASKAEAIIAEVMAPNEKVEALAILQGAAVEAMGLKQGEFKRGEAPMRDVDDELTEALKGTFPASDPVSAESTLVPGSSRGNRR